METSLASKSTVDAMSLHTAPRWIPRVFIPAVIVVILATVAAIVLVHEHDYPTVPPDAVKIGLPVLIGQTVHLPDGGNVDITIPDDGTINQFVQVPSGILFSTDNIDTTDAEPFDAMYLQQTGGVTLDLTTDFNSPWMVNADGSTVVLIESDREAHAINLVTGVDRKTQFGTTDLVNVNGDWALLTNTDLNTPNRPSELWNVRTGAVVPFATTKNVDAWGVGPDGSVLRAVYTSATAEADVDADQPSPACVDYVPPASPVPTAAGGYCGTMTISASSLSPDGAWAEVVVNSQLYLLRTADLHAGRWSPVVPNDDGGSEPMFWDSPTSYVEQYIRDDDFNSNGQSRFERCFVDGHCQDLGAAGSAKIGQKLP
jgi:hypothetical protein